MNNRSSTNTAMRFKYENIENQFDNQNPLQAEWILCNSGYYVAKSHKR